MIQKLWNVEQMQGILLCHKNGNHVIYLTLCSMPRQISQFNTTLFSHFAVQSLSHVRLFLTPWTAAHQASLCFTVSQTLLKLISIKRDMSDAIQPSHPPSSPSPPALSLSEHQGLFQWVFSSHQVAKILELQLQVQFFQWIFRVHFL